MCIACEMAFLDMFEALPPEERERILREEAARAGAPPPAPFVCEPFDDGTQVAPIEPSAPNAGDERKP